MVHVWVKPIHRSNGFRVLEHLLRNVFAVSTIAAEVNDAIGRKSSNTRPKNGTQKKSLNASTATKKTTPPAHPKTKRSDIKIKSKGVLRVPSQKKRVRVDSDNEDAEMDADVENNYDYDKDGITGDPDSDDEATSVVYQRNGSMDNTICHRSAPIKDWKTSTCSALLNSTTIETYAALRAPENDATQAS